jgi:hypothetical protein
MPPKFTDIGLAEAAGVLRRTYWLRWAEWAPGRWTRLAYHEWVGMTAMAAHTPWLCEGVTLLEVEAAKG